MCVGVETGRQTDRERQEERDGEEGRIVALLIKATMLSS